GSLPSPARGGARGGVQCQRTPHLPVLGRRRGRQAGAGTRCCVAQIPVAVLRMTGASRSPAMCRAERSEAFTLHARSLTVTPPCAVRAACLTHSTRRDIVSP